MWWNSKGQFLRHTGLCDIVWGPRRMSDHTYFYVLVVRVKSKGGVLEIICTGWTRNGTVLCEYHQDWFEILSMHKYQIPHANVTKKIWREKIDQCFVFRWTIVFIWASGTSNVVRWWHFRMADCPITLTLSVLMCFINCLVDSLELPHMVQWMCVCLRNF